MEVRGHEDEAGVGGRLEVREEGEGEEKLREVIYLEVGVEIIGCEFKFSYAFASVEDELDMLDFWGCPEATCISYSINLPLVFQLLCDLIRPFQVFEVTLDPLNSVGVSILLELLHCFFCMLFFLGHDNDLGRIVLQEMGRNSKANARCATCHNIHLHFASTIALA